MHLNDMLLAGALFLDHEADLWPGEAGKPGMAGTGAGIFKLKDIALSK